ncbi:PhnD/SsuA/transferrin family substrate-binding protein [Acetobacter musti]|uniref:PhnD/SsuA/transferrin family substrate-binding protein n=1 Tax=Acetobacter musti TaxID=864732 RepID=A0ABX0JV97_9PROT|nr:PhnD/SsuA/transferrin family substrate-binding protein [Acetobacter musti]
MTTRNQLNKWGMMTDYDTVSRRRLLVGAASCSVLALAQARGRAQTSSGSFAVRVASNQGPENATLQRLMLERGYFRALSLDIRLAESRSVSGPMEAILHGEADICMISAYAGILPAIAQGAPVRLVGAALRLPTLAVYSGRKDIRHVSDLAGRTIGVGPRNGLLHILALALLHEKGIDGTRVNFVNIGSNAQVFQAVLSGRVDAGLSGEADADTTTAVHMLSDGKLWEQLPRYTYQTAYASVSAINEKPEALARCIAAYVRLFRYLSSPVSREAYIEARQFVSKMGADEAESAWTFIQKHQPYALNTGLSRDQVDYLQKLNVSAGLQTAMLPFDHVVDLGPATLARQFLSS